MAYAIWKWFGFRILPSTCLIFKAYWIDYSGVADLRLSLPFYYNLNGVWEKFISRGEALNIRDDPGVMTDLLNDVFSSTNEIPIFVPSFNHSFKSSISFILLLYSF